MIYNLYKQTFNNDIKCAKIDIKYVMHAHWTNRIPDILGNSITMRAGKRSAGKILHNDTIYLFLAVL